MNVLQLLNDHLTYLYLRCISFKKKIRKNNEQFLGLTDETYKSQTFDKVICRQFYLILIPEVSKH